MSHILYDKLIEYGKNGKYPFHMPGHKRNDSMLSGMDPFDIDITEIADFDNLHHPQGIIKEAMDRAASYYGTDRTWFLINGRFLWNFSCHKCSDRYCENNNRKKLS